MNTYFNTQTGKEIGYNLQFHTEDREKYEFMQEAARRCIDNEIVSTADVAPVIHAHFVPTEYDGYADGNPVWDTWECSACHEEFYNEGDEPDFCYCPHCGAKMDEEVRSE